jgi:APA family basic amino acid/polyamine antiporter
VMWPVLKSELWFGVGGVGLSGERLGAIMVIACLTGANLRGLNMGKFVQNLFTTAKILSLVLIVAVGCLLFPSRHAISVNFGSARVFFSAGGWSLAYVAAFGGAMVGGLFSADAWACVTFTASEVKNPRRDLPLALLAGTGVVIVLYVLTNVAYLCELPAGGNAVAAGTFARGIAHATSDRVASAAMQIVWGAAGASITAVLVMISTFGCANGLILTGARVIYAMAEDGVFLDAGRRLNRHSVPAFALVIQGVWSAVLALSGTYSDLLDYVIFAQLLFYVLTVAAVFKFRRERPAAPRPYRSWGYPIVPAAYLVAALAMMIDLLVIRPRNAWAGLLIVLAGVPVYYLTARRGAN